MSEQKKVEEMPALAALKVEPGEITFDPSVKEYTMQVAEGTQKLLISAQTAEANQTYIVSGNIFKESGLHDVNITVTAVDGTQTVYTIHVTVGEEVQQSQQTSDSFNLNDIGNVILEKADGINMEIQDFLFSLELPEKVEQFSTYAFSKTVPGRVMLGSLSAAAAAILFWILYIGKKLRLKGMKKQFAAQQNADREKRKQQYEAALRQEEELLEHIRKIERKKAHSYMEQEKGYHIIDLDDEEEYDRDIKAEDDMHDEAYYDEDVYYDEDAYYDEYDEYGEGAAAHQENPEETEVLYESDEAEETYEIFDIPELEEK